MEIKFQDLSRLHQSIEPELSNAFKKTLLSSQFIQGPEVKAFENEFAEYIGVKHCLGVANGTDALEIVLEALGIKAGDRVITPALTFAASAEAPIRAGAIPLFADVDPDTLVVSLKTVQKAFDQSEIKPKALIVVHLYGRICPDLFEIKEWCKLKNIFLIEDTAQAHGAKLTLNNETKTAGSFGDAATFSFYPGKNLGALGDAGAIVTSNTELANRCNRIKDHGRSDKYFHIESGRNSRMDGLQGAFLRVKLKHLDSWTENRKKLVNTYEKELKQIEGFKLFSQTPQPHSHVFHLLIAQLCTPAKTRNQLGEFLHTHKIQTLIHYPFALPDMPAFSKYAKPEDWLISKKIAQEIISLPLDPLMTENEVNFVCEKIHEFFKL